MNVKITAFALAVVTGCAASHRDLDPGELTARDLLGIAPSVALAWDADQREDARAVLDAAMDESVPAAELEVGMYAAETIDRSIVHGFVELDHERWQRGDEPVVVASATRAGPGALIVRRPEVAVTPTAAELAPIGWERGRRAGWETLVDARADALLELARRAGYEPAAEPIPVYPAPQAPFAAVFVASPPMLLVNPIALAISEPSAGADAGDSAAFAPAPLAPGTVGASEAVTPGAVAAANPYSFYGSVAECAASERLRCESCLPNSCDEPSTRGAPSANEECATLAADGGRGYFLLCVNLSLAIDTVAGCVSEAASCPIDAAASNQFDDLADNAAFFDDPVCVDALDACLADIYGEPNDDYPGPGLDAGLPPAPRDTNVGSCGSSNQNCELSPSCSSPSCSSPSCNTAFDCNSSCGGGDCSGSGCESSSSDSGGGCGSDDGDSGGGCSGNDSGDSCTSDCGGNDSGGSCGSCDDSSGSEGGGCGGGDNSCGGGGGNDSCGGGGGGSSCQITERKRRIPAPLFIALLWGIAPLVVMGRWRRRERRRRERDGGAS